MAGSWFVMIRLQLCTACPWMERMATDPNAQCESSRNGVTVRDWNGRSGRRLFGKGPGATAKVWANPLLSEGDRVQEKDSFVGTLEQTTWSICWFIPIALTRSISPGTAALPPHAGTTIRTVAGSNPRIIPMQRQANRVHGCVGGSGEKPPALQRSGARARCISA